MLSSYTTDDGLLVWIVTAQGYRLDVFKLRAVPVNAIYCLQDKNIHTLIGFQIKSD